MVGIAHVDVPKDLNGIRTTFAMGMSGKQLLMLSSGAVVAIGLTAVIKSAFGLSLFTSFLISGVPTLVPVAFCAFYKKNGLSFGKIAKAVIRHKVRQRQLRLYKTANFYGGAASAFQSAVENKQPKTKGKEGDLDVKNAAKTSR